MRRACDSPSADEQSEEEVDIEEEDPEVVALAMASRPKAVKRKAAADVARPRLRQKQA
ncbi:hypothetical protein FQN57_007479 [Myotisia sp. PD_48]|nr:hypothetical protein FQN57_007479 [Myotisia sp. PD_48]